MMGSPKDEMGRYHKETQHKVTLTQIYYIGVFECTQEQWKHVMGNYTSRSCNSNKQPANKVAFSELRGNDKGGQWPSGSEVDSNSFFGKLQKRTGLAFDLPTEAQWEYACRAGMTTALNSGKNITSEREHCPNLDAVGWYDSNSNYDSHPVGLKQPNAWGLYDMHGNISEWCLDWYGEYDKTNAIDPSGAPSGDARVLRGGCLDDHAQNCRSAYRIYSKPSSRFNPSFGFRVALCP